MVFVAGSDGYHFVAFFPCSPYELHVTIRIYTNVTSSLRVNLDRDPVVCHGWSSLILIVGGADGCCRITQAVAAF